MQSVGKLTVTAIVGMVMVLFVMAIKLMGTNVLVRSVPARATDFWLFFFASSADSFAIFFLSLCYLPCEFQVQRPADRH